MPIIVAEVVIFALSSGAALLTPGSLGLDGVALAWLVANALAALLAGQRLFVYLTGRAKTHG